LGEKTRNIKKSVAFGWVDKLVGENRVIAVKATGNEDLEEKETVGKE
jgi:hypothetical protein